MRSRLATGESRRAWQFQNKRLSFFKHMLFIFDTCTRTRISILLKNFEHEGTDLSVYGWRQSSSHTKADFECLEEVIMKKRRPQRAQKKHGSSVNIAFPREWIVRIHKLDYGSKQWWSQDCHTKLHVHVHVHVYNLCACTSKCTTWTCSNYNLCACKFTYQCTHTDLCYKHISFNVCTHCRIIGFVKMQTKYSAMKTPAIAKSPANPLQQKPNTMTQSWDSSSQALRCVGMTSR